MAEDEINQNCIPVNIRTTTFTETKVQRETFTYGLHKRYSIFCYSIVETRLWQIYWNQWGPIKAPWFSFWMLMNTFTVGLWNFQPYCDMTTQTSTPNYSHWFDCWLFRIQNNQIQMKYFHLGKPSIKKGLEIFQTSPPLKVWSLSAAFLTIFCRCAVQFVQYSIACLSECKSPQTA